MGYATAATVGEFHAARVGRRVEAWLGEHRQRMTWPAGWSVRFDPIELISPDGDVFAREGGLLCAGGGLDSADAFAIGPLSHADKGWLDRLALVREGRRDAPPGRE
jgi:hypothetical protein